MAKQPSKFSSKPLAEVLEGVELGETSVTLRDPKNDALALFERLAEKGEHVDALKVAAAALPKREAVWMATRCVREALGDDAPPVQKAALDAAQTWSHDPTDANRRAANDASEKAELDKPAGCVALAAYLSEGSLGPVDVAPIPPAPHLCGVAVGLALQIALALEPQARAAATSARFIAIAREVASTPAPWEPPHASDVAPAATATVAARRTRR